MDDDMNMITSADLNRKRKFQEEPYSSTEPKRVRENLSARGVESDAAEFATDIYDFHDDDDNDGKTYLSCTKSPASIEPSTSCVSWDGTSAEISMYSLESRSVTKPSSDKSKALSICEELDHLHEDLREFGSRDDDGSFLEYQNDGIIDQCTDSDLYVLSSGRWPVNRDNQEGAAKLTIDKEFEQYFSMLMM